MPIANRVRRRHAGGVRLLDIDPEEADMRVARRARSTLAMGFVLLVATGLTIVVGGTLLAVWAISQGSP